MKNVSDETGLAWLTEYQVRTEKQIIALHARLATIKDMIADLKGEGWTPDTVPAPEPKSRKSEPGYVHEPTLALLKKHGDAGITATELRHLQKVPSGTASSRLSSLKRFGHARLDRDTHKYIAVHSVPQDNNSDQATA